MLGGVTVNLFLGIFIYSMTLYTYGDKYLPNENIKDGIWCTDDLAIEIGFKSGDKIISADGVLVERYADILEKVITSEAITVLRGGEETELRMPIDLIDKFLNNKTKLILYPRIPTIVSRVEKGSNAEIGGLQKKDIIKAVNGISYSYFDEFKKALNTHISDTIEVMVDRGGKEVKLTVLVSNEGTLGFAPANLTITQLEKLEVYELASDKYGFFAAFPAGYKKAIKKLGSYISQFKMILSPSTGAYKGMGGFGAIGSMFPATWNWEIFWNLTAFLSLMLAFMNILPIPALDGGHVVFLLYEIVVGKPAPEKVMEYAQAVGMILLLSLLLFANGNDILKLF